ncbi:MAG: choice-of-anchor Q domain-containing protein [Gemmatimonadota bacterium]
MYGKLRRDVVRAKQRLKASRWRREALPSLNSRVTYNGLPDKKMEDLPESPPNSLVQAEASSLTIAILLACAFASTACFPRPGSPGFFEVTSGDDAVDDNAGDGLCRSTLPGGPCTLRAAIQESNALIGESTILLGPRTHRLTLLDHLHVTDGVRMTGSGATQTVIDGTDRGGRVFHFDGSLAWLTDLNIINGGPDVSSGGAIYIRNRAFVSLTNVVIDDNEAYTGGGGIHLEDGRLLLIDSSVSDNRATGAFAGGIYVQASGTLTIDRSTIDSNRSNRCGGIYNFGRITVSNSTISGNSAGSTTRGTGGIINVGTAHFNNVTIYNNSSNARGDAQSSGGLLSVDGSTRITLSNTIIAGNTRGGAANDCTGRVTSYGYNLIQNADECTVTDIVAGNIIDRDPQLLPLAYNFGAATQSHLPASFSPAINAGHPQVGPGVSALGRCEARDQANMMRQLTGSGRRCDIGSIEAR